MFIDHIVLLVSGEFATSLRHYQITHPHRITSDGTFLTHHLPHRVRRSTRFGDQLSPADDSQHVHYHIPVDDMILKLKLRPNHRLLAPGFVVEHKKYTFGNVSDSTIRQYSDHLCHFTGEIVDHPGSSVAIATCNGLVSTYCVVVVVVPVAAVFIHLLLLVPVLLLILSLLLLLLL